MAVAAAAAVSKNYYTLLREYFENTSARYLPVYKPGRRSGFVKLPKNNNKQSEDRVRLGSVLKKKKNLNLRPAACARVARCCSTQR